VQTTHACVEAEWAGVVLVQKVVVEAGVASKYCRWHCVVASFAVSYAVIRSVRASVAGAIWVNKMEIVCRCETLVGRRICRQLAAGCAAVFALRETVIAAVSYVA
jgi:hypothetical protein